MGAELLPALVATVGGGVMLAVIVAGERRDQARMRASRTPAVLTFPLATSPAAALQALDALTGMSADVEIVVEVAARGEAITHRLYLPDRVAEAVTAQLRAAIPGLRVRAEEPSGSSPWRLRLMVTVPPKALLREGGVEHGRSMLAAVLPLYSGEELAVRWALRPGRPRTDSELSALPRETERQHERAWTAKLAGPGLFVSGLVLVRAADSGRARALAARVAAVLHARRGARGDFAIRRSFLSRDFPRGSRRSGWLSTGELLPALGWPLGDEVPVGVEVGAARQVPAREALSRRGRPLLVSEQHGRPRPVALSVEAARHHMAVLGPTGSGKSAVLAAGILSDLTRGSGGVVVDPKGDLIRDVLDRVPAAADHADRVVVIDPSDPGPIPGVDLLGHGDPDLRADMLVTVLRSLFRDAWGPRTDAYVRLGARTLAELPGASLSDWPLLFLDPAFRRQVVARLHDPLLVGQWAAYESLSEAERAQHIAAPMSRIVSLIGRPAVRAVLAQPHPRVDAARLLAERRWLMVSLASGVIGEPAARLIGATITYAVWSAVSARAAIPEDKRRPVFLYFDETQALSDLGVGLEALLEQARGLKAGITVATQAVARIAEPTRTALLANVATLLTFKAGADEAARIARELPGLSAQDLQSLAPFEVAARVGTGKGAGSLVVTGRTEPLGEPTGQAQHIRDVSAERYGRSREQIEAAWRERYEGSARGDEPADDVGRGRRS